jgi:uncharacterized membrane protein YqjE
MSAVGSLRRIAAHALRLVSLRAALAAEEIDAARMQWLRWAALALLAVMLATLTLLALGAAVAAAFWPAVGWPILLAVGAGYGLAAYLLLSRVQSEVRAAPPLLDVTRRELARDFDLLRGNASASGSAEAPHG